MVKRIVSARPQPIEQILAYRTTVDVRSGYGRGGGVGALPDLHGPVTSLRSMSQVASQERARVPVAARAGQGPTRRGG